MMTPSLPKTCIFTLLCLAARTESACIEHTFTDADLTVCAENCVNYANASGCVNTDDYEGDIVEVFVNSDVRKFRRGAFIDAPHLKGIHAPNSSLEIVYPKAFVNLPEINVIDLSGNSVEDIVFDVFNNLNVQTVILSFNNIEHIDRGAFSNMPHLSSLLLDYNRLKEFNKYWLCNSTALRILDLSNNDIQTLRAWSFEKFPDLSYLDVSFNRIAEIGLGSFLNVKRLQLLDLTSNNLTELKSNVFYRGITIRELRIPSNRISSLDEELFITAHIHAVSLYVNPWKCPDLKNALIWTKRHDCVVLDAGDDERIDDIGESPVCFCPEDIIPVECAL